MDDALAIFRVVLLCLTLLLTSLGVATAWIARIGAWDAAAGAAAAVGNLVGSDWDCVALPATAETTAAGEVAARLPPGVTPTVMEVSTGGDCAVRVVLAVQWFHQSVLLGWSQQVAAVCRPAGPSGGGPVPLAC